MWNIKFQLRIVSVHNAVRPQPCPGSCTLQRCSLVIIAAAGLQTEAAKRAAVEAAVADIHALIRGERLQPRQPAVYNAAAPPSYNAAPPPGHLASAPPPVTPWTAPPASGPPAASAHMLSLFMGFDAPPAFNLVSRLQGPGQRLHTVNIYVSSCHDTRHLNNNVMCISAWRASSHSSCRSERVLQWCALDAAAPSLQVLHTLITSRRRHRQHCSCGGRALARLRGAGCSMQLIRVPPAFASGWLHGGVCDKTVCIPFHAVSRFMSSSQHSQRTK